jgi:hypothetical protein
MCICTCVYTPVHIHKWTYIGTCLFIGIVHMHTRVYMYICKCLCVHMWTRTFMWIRACISLCVFMCLCTHVLLCMYMQANVYLCMHTYVCMRVCVPLLPFLCAYTRPDAGVLVCFPVTSPASLLESRARSLKVQQVSSLWILVVHVPHGPGAQCEQVQAMSHYSWLI